MAEILELEDVLVIDAVYNTAAEGAAESNSFMGGLSAALFYRPKNAGLMTPSAGYVFSWTGLIGTTGGAGVRNPPAKGDWVTAWGTQYVVTTVRQPDAYGMIVLTVLQRGG